MKNKLNIRHLREIDLVEKLKSKLCWWNSYRLIVSHHHKVTTQQLPIYFYRDVKVAETD
jgi:hypothetical protein